MLAAWEKAFGRMTYGLYVLTTIHEGIPNGMIASWVSQVSYEPPLVMAAVHPNRYSHGLVKASGGFVLNVITRGQSDFLVQFKQPDRAALFESLDWITGKTGCPILKGCSAYLECKVVARYDPGNHTLFIGEVQDGQVLSDDPPLTTLDYSGVYLGKQ